MLAPKDGATYFDGTFGGGGYTKAILDAANCSVIACDRDSFVQPIADNFTKEYGKRFDFRRAKFSEIKSVIADCRSVDFHIDGVVLDLGISNFQISDSSRGFSFKLSGPLDMTMGLCTENALDVIHNYSESELADIIYQLGEEPFSRSIAKGIKQNLKSIKSTEDLAEIVRKYTRKSGKIDPATKTFQALRIFVNDELQELKDVLQEAFTLLNSGGKIIIVSFHSLEDRIIKYFFKEIVTNTKKRFQLINKKPISPSDKELSANPKSRSAKLRGICML